MKFNRNYIYPFMATSLWGSMFAASKIVLATVPPVTVLLFRYTIACVALAIMGTQKKVFRRVEKQHWFALFCIGFIGYFIAIICQLCGTARIGASMSSLINALNPVTMPIAAALVLHEKLTKRRAAAVVVAMIGVYIVLGVNTSGMTMDYVGALISFGCVVFFTIGSLIMRKISGKYDPIQITIIGMLFALVFTVPASGWELMNNPCSFRPITFLCLLYMGVCGTAIPHFCWNKGLRLLDTGTCSMFYPMQPIVAVIISSLFLGESLTLSFVVGALIIISAIFVGLSDRN